MSIFTVDECDVYIAALKCQMLEDPMGTIGSVSINGRTVTYKDAEDLEKTINLWTRLRSTAAASAAGRSGTNPKVARFV